MHSSTRSASRRTGHDGRVTERGTVLGSQGVQALFSSRSRVRQSRPRLNIKASRFLGDVARRAVGDGVRPSEASEDHPAPEARNSAAPRTAKHHQGAASSRKSAYTGLGGAWCRVPSSRHSYSRRTPWRRTGAPNRLASHSSSWYHALGDSFSMPENPKFTSNVASTDLSDAPRSSSVRTGSPPGGPQASLPPQQARGACLSCTPTTPR